jgi:hypothetical protein
MLHWYALVKLVSRIEFENHAPEQENALYIPARGIDL